MLFLLRFLTGGLGMNGPPLLPGIPQPVQIQQCGRWIDSSARVKFNPLSDLSSGPFPTIIGCGLEARIKRGSPCSIQNGGLTCSAFSMVLYDVRAVLVVEPDHTGQPTSSVSKLLSKQRP